MSKSKLETAQMLAKAHFEVEPYLRQVYLLEPLNEMDRNDPIKLLEIVEGTIERGIEPIGFAPDPEHGVEYPCLIVEVSPREYTRIRDRELDFGNRGWTIGTELHAV